MSHQKGFALLETMLVMALLAIIASVGILAIRRQLETSRIQKTGQEIKQVLQAALAYYVDHQHTWPSNNMNLPGYPLPYNNRSAFTIYLPNHNRVSELGTRYCWGTESDNRRLFWVAIKTPNQSVAKRIAAQVPNAIATADPRRTNPPPCTDTHCYVRAEIIEPSDLGVKRTEAYITAIGHCRHGKTIDHCAFVAYGGVYTDSFRVSFPACPKSMLPKATAAPNNITLHLRNADISSFQVATQCQITINPKTKQQSCVINAIAKLRTLQQSVVNIAVYGGTVGLSYVVACVPKKLMQEATYIDS